MIVKLLTKHHLEFLSLKGTGVSESTLVKMPHCWKSYVAAQIIMDKSHLWIRYILQNQQFSVPGANSSLYVEPKIFFVRTATTLIRLS